MTTARVACGQCGFAATVQARTDQNGFIQVQIDSACAGLQALGERLSRIDPYEDGGTFFGSSVYQAANACLQHVDCIVPAAVVRAVHVEAGIAVPHAASVRIERD